MEVAWHYHEGEELVPLAREVKQGIDDNSGELGRLEPPIRRLVVEPALPLREELLPFELFSILIGLRAADLLVAIPHDLEQAPGRDAPLRQVVTK